MVTSRDTVNTDEMSYPTIPSVKSGLVSSGVDKRITQQKGLYKENYFWRDTVDIENHDLPPLAQFFVLYFLFFWDAILHPKNLLSEPFFRWTRTSPSSKIVALFNWFWPTNVQAFYSSNILQPVIFQQV